jgi:hypothetical protein
MSIKKIKLHFESFIARFYKIWFLERFFICQNTRSHLPMRTKEILVDELMWFEVRLLTALHENLKATLD